MKIFAYETNMKKMKEYIVYDVEEIKIFMLFLRTFNETVSYL